jgi:hypothetical protein
MKAAVARRISKLLGMQWIARGNLPVKLAETSNAQLPHSFTIGP